MMKRILVLLCVSALSLMAKDVYSQCVDVAGTWNYSLGGTLNCTVAARQINLPVDEAGTATIIQNGCNVTGQEGTLSGTISGNTMQASGSYPVHNVPNFTLSQDSLTASGTVSADGTSMTLTGSVSADGTYLYNGTSYPVQCTGTGFNVAFTLTAPSLTLAKSGTGSGTVTSIPPGINCGGTCGASYTSDTAVTLTARADAGSYFAGWGPPCSGISLCTLTLTAGTQVAATFSPGYFDTVQGVYIGYYQRPADPGGLLYWAERLDSTQGNLNEIIEAYANSPESQALYGTINGSNISAVVNDIYHALFNRDAETEGLNYYVNGFNAGHFTAATIMLNVLYGAQNSDLQSVNDKLAAANLFTRIIDPELDGTNFEVTYAGDQDAIAARSFLASVTDDPATLPTQDETTAWMKNYIANPGDPILSK